MFGQPTRSTLFPYTTLFRSLVGTHKIVGHLLEWRRTKRSQRVRHALHPADEEEGAVLDIVVGVMMCDEDRANRSEEHTSELQSRRDLVCRLLLEKKKEKVRL